MTRADGPETKVHYRGKVDDFVVIVESVEAVKRWKSDKSVPLIDVVNSFDIFCTHKYARYPATGALDFTNCRLGMELKASWTGLLTPFWRTSSERRTRMI